MKFLFPFKKMNYSKEDTAYNVAQDSLSDIACNLKKKCDEMFRKNHEKIQNQNTSEVDDILNDVKSTSSIRNNKGGKKNKTLPSDKDIKTENKSTYFNSNKISFLSKKRDNSSAKRGRPKKDSEPGDRKHTKYNADNAKRRAIIECIHNYGDLIEKIRLELYEKCKLFKVTINAGLYKKDKDIKDLYKCTYKKIYEESKVKRENEKNKDIKKEQIKEILKKEEENNNTLISDLLNKEIKEIMNLYLNDVPFLVTFNNAEKKTISLKFLTLKDGLKDFKPETKEKVKKNLLNLLG